MPGTELLDALNSLAAGGGGGKWLTTPESQNYMNMIQGLRPPASPAPVNDTPIMLQILQQLKAKTGSVNRGSFHDAKGNRMKATDPGSVDSRSVDPADGKTPMSRKSGGYEMNQSRTASRVTGKNTAEQMANAQPYIGSEDEMLNYVMNNIGGIASGKPDPLLDKIMERFIAGGGNPEDIIARLRPSGAPVR